MERYMLIVQRRAGDHTAIVTSDNIDFLKSETINAKHEMCAPAFPGRESKHRAMRIRIVEICYVSEDWTAPDISTPQRTLINDELKRSSIDTDDLGKEKI